MVNTSNNSTSDPTHTQANQYNLVVHCSLPGLDDASILPWEHS